ncbi:MAG: ABC transporter ATP-binding protein [Rhodovibrionaceae bacterium]
MSTVFRIFFGTKGVNEWLVLLCLLAAAIAEGIGLTALLPLLTLAQDSQADADSPVTSIFTDVLAAVGLPETFEVLLVVLVVSIILKSMLTLAAMRYVGYAVADVATSLQTRLTKNILRARWGYFSGQPIGRFANAISLETTRGSTAYLQSANFVSLMIQTAIYIVVAVLVSWQLGFVALLVGAGIASLLHTLVRVAKNAGRRQTKRNMELVSQLSDALSGIKPLKAMARHKHLQIFFNQKIQDLRLALRRKVISQEALKNLQEPILVIFLGVGFYVALKHYGIPLTSLLVMGLLFQRTVSTIGKLQQQLQKVMVSESAYFAVQDAIAEAKRAREPNPGTKVPTLEGGCALQRVSFSFGRKQVLRDISLTIPPHQLTVIMGPSGIGKTTITDLLLGLYEPDEGKVLIDGMNIQEVDLEKWRGMIGYVPQELFLFHDSIFANISLGYDQITEELVEEALKAADAWGFVSELEGGMHSVVGERGSRLSGGQRQRIAIARALVHKPRLLILDEVTSALDPESEREICANIRSLAGDLTIVSITHRPAWVEGADNVYHLGLDGLTQIPAAAAK